MVAIERQVYTTRSDLGSVTRKIQRSPRVKNLQCLFAGEAASKRWVREAQRSELLSTLNVKSNPHSGSKPNALETRANHRILEVFVLHIPKSIFEQLQFLAASAKPLEIVGLLGGSELTRVSTLIPLENDASDPTRRFEADRHSLVHGLKILRESRLELCALYHSHPNGPALPSKVDLENAQWDVPMLIVDAVTLNVRAWRLVDGSEVKLEVIS